MEIKYYTYPNTVDNKNAGIEIRQHHELTKDELFLLNQAGLDSYAPIEAWYFQLFWKGSSNCSCTYDYAIHKRV